MSKKSLYIISAAYPFGKGEEFMSKELKELTKYFSKIYLFPLTAKGNQRWIPDNVELNYTLSDTSRIIPKKYFVFNFFLLLKVFLLEFFNSDKKGFIIKELRTLANSLLQTKKMSETFRKQLADDRNAYFYSVWMDDGALLFSILRQQGTIDKFVIRLHGYDLFDERRKGNYMPFRYFIFRNAQRIFVLSKAGYNYLLNKNIFPEKLVQNYSGLYDHGVNPFDKESRFTIVSCSNVIGIKRLDKIVKTLSYLNFPVNWVHFGDGDQMLHIKELACGLPSNINYLFKGNLPNEEILNYYKTESVNLFIHLSDTEGLGMAIVEAQSFGIPALAVNVGGVNEVVNERTGILVSLSDSCKEIADKIVDNREGLINLPEYRKGVKLFWQSRFNAEENYRIFYEKIIN